VTIIGVGFDSPNANTAWSEGEIPPFTFELWTDGDRQLATYYDAVANQVQVNPSRVTKVLDPSGTLVLEYVADIAVGTHPGLVLADCQALFGGQ
jgi:peroxiredoxin